MPRAKSSQATVNNSSGHLTNDGYAIICAWLSKPSNYSSCLNGFNLMVNELNKKTKLTKGIITISQKLNLMCPCYEQMDHIFGSLPNANPLGGGDPKQHTWTLPQTTNESTDEDSSEDIQNRPYHPQHMLSFTRQKQIVNNAPHHFVDSAREKWSKESELRMKQEEVKKELEYKKLKYSKEEKDKDLVYAREEKENNCEFKLLLAEKEKEALKRKEDRDLLLAVVGSSRSLAEISKIAKILKVD
ncbi:hypothetical protein PPACK8108_LOCUS8371 [Phakopsora pachyrhizi]|uniref:No apical meristem-associated C-terminal domain-containing protein n=1 Tax=Phakopsora pachyrhizi TaxID=170000 RepID=A0AAV0AX49_PHAPC|nr:hypothetical protein PPACK8108_LOCUS8371 [Phakopsora pachyrhizi]